MTDGTGATPQEPTPAASEEPRTSDTWDELGRQLSELGAAIGRAVQAGIDDPENRRRAAEVRDELAAMATRVGTAFDEAAGSPRGQRVKEEVGKAAETVAAAGRKVAEDVRPHLIEAARTASEKIREAAAGIEQRAKAAQDDAPGPPDVTGSSSDPPKEEQP
jgi:hypothetical protein